MIELYFVRHSETLWNNSGKYQGHSDVALSEKGLKQATRVGEYFKDISLDAIFCSDMIRTRETARAIKKYHKNITITETFNLREINFGAWEGLTYNEICERWPGYIDEMYNSPMTINIENGETFLELQKRAMQEMVKILHSDNDNKSFAIVCHGGTIRCILCSLLGLNLNFAWNFKQDNANISIIHYYGQRNLLALLNDTHHLDNI